MKKILNIYTWRVPKNPKTNLKHPDDFILNLIAISKSLQKP